jgi:hypothetical protein
LLWQSVQFKRINLYKWHRKLRQAIRLRKVWILTRRLDKVSFNLIFQVLLLLHPSPQHLIDNILFQYRRYRTFIVAHVSSNLELCITLDFVILMQNSYLVAFYVRHCNITLCLLCPSLQHNSMLEWCSLLLKPSHVSNALQYNVRVAYPPISVWTFDGSGLCHLC